MNPLDVLQAALLSYNITLQFMMAVYKDTPDEIRKAEAANIGKFLVNSGNFFISIQTEINKLVLPK